MRILILLPLILLMFAIGCAPKRSNQRFASPDGRISLDFRVVDGTPHYAVLLDGRPALQESKLGLVRDDEDFSTGLSLLSVTAPRRVEDHYEILTAKRRSNTYIANGRTFHLQTQGGKKLDIVFQISNDGVAFRYVFPERSDVIHAIKEEVTSFRMNPGTLAWLQPMSAAKSGWQRTNPSYEEYYQKEIAAGTPSPLGAGWVFPALFKSGDTWLLLSETSLGRGYCGARLRHESPDGEYAIGFPDPRETMNDQPVNPHSTLPWSTPWRLIVIGDLKTIAESTLGIDLAEKPTVSFDATGAPGKSSWSWVLLGDRNTNFDTQKRFIDYAADMGWSYCLVDALWDVQIGYDRMKELADYASRKKIGLILWYNSNGSWNGAPQTPKDHMYPRENRIAEFEKLKAMGIKGLKVDFFGGDGQAVINYYIDILEDAAKYGLAINFHGATLPRGWQRTYPNLMTMEAIKGFEFVTFEQQNADNEPSHAATIPFTRNVFDPMDFTPVCLDRINGRVQRRTTSAFELALAVLFTSGIQHYAEIPEGMAKMPPYVQDFMKQVPAVWEDVRFIDGYPGQWVAIARKGNGRWYLAVINGEGREKAVSLDLSSIPGIRTLTLISDGDGSEHFTRRQTAIDAGKKLDLTLKPNGGAVVIFE
jgi:hypothetical protein